MSDNDLIRRGDALNACRASEHRYEAYDAIDALPAVTQSAPDADDRIEAQAAEIERLRLLVPRPDQTQDELVWRDHMRGVPLAALAKEFGVTKERMRYRLKKIAENKLHLTGNQP